MKKCFCLSILVVCIAAATAFAGPDAHWGETTTYWAPPGAKEVEGWTVWQGEYHYTRARLGDGSIADSGRRWGWHGTNASCKGFGMEAIAATGYTFWGN